MNTQPDLLLSLAAGASAITCGLHIFGGRLTTVRPTLNCSELDHVPKYWNYYCWHVVTIVLAAMTVCYALGAFRPESRELVILMTFFAASFLVWSAGLVVWKKQKPLELPQWLLFLPITTFGALGLWW